MDRKTTDLQYRTLHHGIATRYKLLCGRMQERSVCTRCDNGAEDLIHLFLDCPYSQRVWNYTKQLIQLVICQDISTLNDNVVILTGFTHLRLPIHIHTACEDLRTSYWHAVWTSRNKSLWENTTVDALPLFRKKLQHILTIRYIQASDTNRLPHFFQTYAHSKLFSISFRTVNLLI